MDLIYAILSGIVSIFVSSFAVEAEHIFFKIIYLIIGFIAGCISIAKFHSFSEDYGSSIIYVIAQIIIIVIFIAALGMSFSCSGFTNKPQM